MTRFALLLCPVLAVVLLARPAPAGDKEPDVKNLDKLNTGADETDPFPVDGLTLLYATNKAGNWDVMVSHRTVLISPWPAGKPHPDLSSKDADERSPFQYKT